MIGHLEEGQAVDSHLELQGFVLDGLIQLVEKVSRHRIWNLDAGVGLGLDEIFHEILGSNFLYGCLQKQRLFICLETSQRQAFLS